MGRRSRNHCRGTAAAIPIIIASEYSAANPFAPLVRYPGMVRVSSSAMNRVEYDPARRRLAIRFSHGGWYTYLGVPARVAEGLLAAPSLGRYFHARIRDRFPFLRRRG